ncbi:helix-turn-helix domain-containing protein [Salicibibacter halophilus]|uniref:Helix-turn-helix domain-containing protein n=1 Tax=Salicibibacter halophilus TaxID=2502791 RepID=A0A514LF90_9BACI|nr:helix-turn-helix domain-containing protein [Salicibibacter halophilus]QDI90225.1 helix-turn-helix domain-containing protein [Salicibibacter halophilus]
MAKGKYHKWLTYEGLVLLEGWARDGLTDEQIARNMGITTSTYYEWMKKHVDISDAIKKGKEVADYEVENAMHKAARGYYQEEESVTNKGDVVTVKKWHPPNPTMAIFWLKNRKASTWRDKQDHTVEDVTPRFIEDVPQDD